MILLKDAINTFVACISAHSKGSCVQTVALLSSDLLVVRACMLEVMSKVSFCCQISLFAEECKDTFAKRQLYVHLIEVILHLIYLHTWNAENSGAESARVRVRVTSGKQFCLLYVFAGARF